MYDQSFRWPPQNLPFSFFSLQARCPAFLILTLWWGSCGIFCVPEIATSPVAKDVPLVRAAQTPPDSALRGHCNRNRKWNAASVARPRTSVSTSPPRLPSSSSRTSRIFFAFFSGQELLPQSSLRTAAKDAKKISPFFTTLH